MPAEGKKNTVGLAKGDRIMVRLAERPPSEDGVVDVYPSWTKVKQAVVMNVYDVEATRSSGVRQRLTYHVHGVLADGRRARVPHAGGGQTYWLAKEA